MIEPKEMEARSRSTEIPPSDDDDDATNDERND